MSLYLSPGSPFWQYDFQIRRRRFHGSTHTKDRSEAARIERAEKAKARRELAAEAESGGARAMTIDRACGHYWLDVAQHKTTAKTMHGQTTRLVKHFGKDTPLHEIDDAAVVDYISVARGRRSGRHRKDNKKAPLVSPATVNREIELLRRVLRHAAKARKARVTPIEWKRHLLPEPTERVRSLTTAEETRLLNEAAPHLRPAIRFALLTGVRLSSAIGLDWRQVDLQARTVTFRVKTRRRNTPMSKTLSLPVVGELLTLLASLDPKDAGPVFLYTPRRKKGRPPAKPRPIKSWRKAWMGALRRAGIEDFRWHDLRHTFATRVRRNGGDLRVLKDLMAHEDIKSTLRYAHADDADKRAALASLSTVDGSSESRNSPGADTGTDGK